jgi:hypothetical protein
VHWVRDVTFDKDRSTVRTGAAPQVMARLRNTAPNLHHLAGADNIAEACRTTAFSPDRPPHSPREPSNQQFTSMLVNNAEPWLRQRYSDTFNIRHHHLICSTTISRRWRRVWSKCGHDTYNRTLFDTENANHRMQQHRWAAVDYLRVINSAQLVAT